LKLRTEKTTNFKVSVKIKVLIFKIGVLVEMVSSLVMRPSSKVNNVAESKVVSVLMLEIVKRLEGKTRT
jgi:hypothetical protein